MTNQSTSPQIQAMVDAAKSNLAALLTRDVEAAKCEMKVSFENLKLHAGTGTINTRPTRKSTL